MNSLKWLATFQSPGKIRAFVRFKMLVLILVYSVLVISSILLGRQRPTDVSNSTAQGTNTTEVDADGNGLIGDLDLVLLYLIPLSLLYPALAPFFCCCFIELECDSWETATAPERSCDRYVAHPVLNFFVHQSVFGIGDAYIREELVISENDYIWTAQFIALHAFAFYLMFVGNIHPAVIALSMLLFALYLLVDIGPIIYYWKRRTKVGVVSP